MPHALLTQAPENRHSLATLLQEKGWELTCRSFISTEPIDFDKELERFTWVFFSSKNSAKHFFERSPILSEHVKIGAIGSGTAEQLRLYTHVHFVGNTTDTEKVGLEFSKLLSPIDEVLFPIGFNSLRTIQRQIDSSQVQDLICYETRLIPAEIPSFDAYVFSSPSNAKSFLSKNNIASSSKVFSFGASTTKSLRQLGVQDPIELKDYSDETIAMAIISA